MRGSRRFTFLWAALFILLIGFSVRVALHDYHGLEGDDGVSLSVSLGNDVNTLVRELLALRMDIHPPLHYILLKGWTGLAGDSLLSLRLMNVLADALAGALLMRVAGRVLDRRAALVAGLLWSLSPLLIYATYLIRMYALMALFASLGMVGIVEAAYARPRWLWYGLTAASGLAAVYTHIVGTVVLALFSVGMVVSGLARRVRLHDVLMGLGWLVIAAILSLPYLGPIWAVYRSGRQLGAQYSSAMFDDPISAAASSLTVMLAHQLWGERLLMLIILLLFALGSLLVWQRYGRRVIPLLAMFWVGLAAMSGLAWIAHIYKPRYLAPFVPLALILLAGMVTGLPHPLSPSPLRREGEPRPRTINGWIVGLVMLLTVLISGAGIFRDLDRTLRDDFAAAAQFVEAHERPGDVVIVIPDYGWYPFQYHFHGQSPTYGLFSRVNIAANFELGITPLIEGKTGVWYVLYQADVADPDGMADKWLRERGATVTEVYPRSIRLKYYDLRPKSDALPAYARPLDIRFGNVAALRGIYLPVSKGGARDNRLHPPSNWVQVILYWQTLQPGANIMPQVRLINPMGEVYGGPIPHDNDVLTRSPIPTWQADDIWQVATDLNLNPQAPPGKYYVEIRVIDPTTGQAIPTSTGEAAITTGEFTIQ
ncbi:MAG: glycosyltransferase family 39 protein [Anaerolineae bacterium]|nr:glycosyltransferase family 39 protein [Anaerolineae bacterium]